jgi:hypothetical protein
VAALASVAPIPQTLFDDLDLEREEDRAEWRRRLATPGVVRDELTSLVWQRVMPDELQMLAHVDAACEGLELAGSSDWCVPSNLLRFLVRDVVERACCASRACTGWRE